MGTVCRIRTVEKELLVYDTNDMIGAIGGSLGLFLGFSFFNVICMCLDKFVGNVSLNQILNKFKMY